MSVYFAACERIDVVKIGYSSADDPSMRVRSLRTACPLPLRLALVVPEGDGKLERRLHATFAELRLEGEWFACRGKLRDMLESATGGRDEPVRVGLGRLYQLLSDTLFNGKPHPAIPMTEEEYDATGDRALWPELDY